MIILTPNSDIAYNLLTMAGTVRCAKCRKQRDDYKCPHCGERKCYVKLYWQGEFYQYRNYDNGIPYGFYEAQRLLNKLQSEIDDHKRKRKEFDPTKYLKARIDKLRFIAVVDRWLGDAKTRVTKRELSPGTHKTYDVYRRTLWGISCLRDMDIREITAKDLKQFKTELPDNLSNTYKRKVLNALRTFMRWAHREDIIDAVPLFPLVGGDDSKLRTAITIESQDMYLSKIPEVHQDIIRFGFATGIREGELAALKVKDVDAESWTLTVQRTYSRGNILVETTKGKHKDTIPLSDEAVKICKDHLQNLPEAFLFINPITGRGYMPQMIYKVWKATGSPVTFHEAGRHSFATQIAKAGAKAEQIMRLCRHRDIRTSMRYIHTDLTDLREVTNKRLGSVSVLEVKKAKENKK